MKRSGHMYYKVQQTQYDDGQTVDEAEMQNNLK